MPEINHVFNQGKMNKDLDERLVPNGQYRDAMNIQISTSEGADIGAVQNILGNRSVTEPGFFPQDAKCVGVCADEKNNLVYWLITSSVKDAIFSYNSNSKAVTPVLVDTNKNVLGFKTNYIITGINIIDDLLLWTDNDSEPKKINVKLCQQGTPSANTHTKLIVIDRNIDLSSNNGLGIDIRQEHITVIKKAPKNQVSLNLSADNSISASFAGSLLKLNGSAYAVNDVIILENINISGNGIISVGNTLFFKEFGAIGILPFYFQFSVKIIEDISGNPTGIGGPVLPPNSFRAEVLTTTNNSGLNWEILKVGDTSSSIFEKQLARFSCRYKYQDGEYSTFAPFSEIAFIPSIFNYEVKKAYNSGMQNYLQSLVINNFIQQDILEDVVQVDILYKESNSTNVYIVDKIKYKNSDTGAVSANWSSDSYNVESDIIYALLPSNQLLRPYDNVPRKALAQEMTGNRVVYGNYVQNYNIGVKPIVEAWYDVRQGANQNILFPSKSLKSLRNYQLGITYLDDFGRETPVFTNSLSTFKIPKKESANKNAINFKINTSAPNWASSYKMFVKETSNEYYNLAMDRVYRAKDGNIWLSFPSSDRNKVDEETFLILKKQLDADVQVEESLKYKIIAIESEAPEFVKTKSTFLNDVVPANIQNLFKDNGTSSGNDLLVPFTSSNVFEINELVFKADGGTSIDNIEDALSIVFRDSATNVSSDFYNISNVAYENGIYTISMDRNLSLDDTFIYTDYSTITSATPADLNSNLEIKVYKNITKNKPEFDGRFFVKIENDTSTEQYVLKSAAEAVSYRSSGVANAYYLSDKYSSYTGSLGQLQDYSGHLSGTTYANSQVNQSATKWRWMLNFSFIEHTTPASPIPSSQWFIDQAYYAGTQQLSGVLDETLEDQGYGKGVYKDSNGQWFMELSFGQIEPDAMTVLNGNFNAIVNYTTGGGGSQITGDLNTEPLEDQALFAVGSSLNQNHINQSRVVSSLVENKLFQFLGDQNEIRYKINGPVVKQQRYNYMVWKEVYDFWDGPWKLGHYTTHGTQNPSIGPISWSRYYNNNSRGKELDDLWDDFARSLNRRVTYIIPFCLENGAAADPDINSLFLDGSNTYTNFLDSTYGADHKTAHSIQFLEINQGDEDQLVSNNPAIWETEPKENIDLNIFHEASGCFDISLHGTTQELDWFNCYSFGNGVESNRLRDDFNQIIIDKGAIVSSTTDSTYEEERRKSGLIYSGLYNSTNGINNLNQFIAAEKITKDINPTYGSIQKLFSRNTDLVTFCEDKVIRILANKDAIFNADGNPNLIATQNVLGQTMPFSGDYGISRNPESFSFESYRAYFSDKQRGAVLRLSMDGITPISQYGMSDYFRDNLKISDKILGSYDTNKREYNISLVGKDLSSTISFNEDVKGWSSFKSFVPEQGISVANDYYTAKNGILYKHHDEDVDRNNFYDEDEATPSSITVLLNDEPGVIKSYKTLNYTGSKSWYAEYIESEKQNGFVNEFVKKEGKWFNFIKGEEIVDNLNIKTEEFSFQGLGFGKLKNKK
jgi:hypothetical protein